MNHSQQKISHNPLPIDRCLRHAPFFDRQMFLKQVKDSDNELIELLPESVRNQHEDYKNVSRYLTVGFWTINLAAISFIHKIPVIGKRLPTDSRIALFLIRLSLLSLPFYGIAQFQMSAQDEHLRLLFKQCFRQYKLYKMTGDVTCLNPQIVLYQRSQNATSRSLTEYSIPQTTVL